MPARTSRRVVLPAPFGPMMPMISPALDRSRGGRAPDNAAKARHRPTTDRAQMQSHAPGDRPAPPLQGRTNKTAALDPAPTDPSWPVPAADRVNVRESLFAEAFNRLLQQNRHETDLPRCPQFGRYRGESGRSRVSSAMQLVVVSFPPKLHVLPSLANTAH